MATAKKILKLDTISLEDDFFDNAALIGISSDKAVFSLCALFNKAFSLRFVRNIQLDVVVGKKNGDTYSFAVYQSCVTGTAFIYTFYKLKVEDVHLLPSIKNIDYIWLIRGEDVLDAEDLAMVYLKQLQSMPEIQFATLLEKDKIKNVDYLIL